MPTGTPYHSFIPPYAIRVDEFTDSASLSILPALHLLTHTHADHIAGLSAKSFASTVICSQDAKEMLLRHEVYAERALHEMDVRVEKVRTFQHLKVAPRALDDGTLNHIGSRDLLKVLPLRTPSRFELSSDNHVTITAFDANHCPGAVMYLLEGTQGTVLHTGDFRAEQWFLESLVKEPILQKYLAVPDIRVEPHARATALRISETLEAIFLDTACLMSMNELPSKAKATFDLVALMKLYPSTTHFFINSWTWGYEDVLKDIARAFQSKIHVDRYKNSVYMHLSDPFLRHIITTDATTTRFHACERFDRCEYVRVDGRASHTANGTHVVYVNPVNMGIQKWEEYVRDTRNRLTRGEDVNILLVPLSRHSSLPELRAFVSLFKPKRLIPNTLDPALAGLDCACLPSMFAGCVSSDTEMRRECSKICASIPSYSDWTILTQGIEHGSDAAFQNLEGEGALEIAQRWADSGKSRRKLEILRSYLQGPQDGFVNSILADNKERLEALHFRIQPLPEENNVSSGSALVTSERAAQGRATLSQTAQAMSRLQRNIPRVVPHGFLDPGSDEETEDEEDAHLRTAELLFLSQSWRPAELGNLSPMHSARQDSLNPTSPSLLKQHPERQAGTSDPVSVREIHIPPTPMSSERPENLRASPMPISGCISPIIVPTMFPDHRDMIQVPQTPPRYEVHRFSPARPNPSSMKDPSRKRSNCEIQDDPEPSNNSKPSFSPPGTVDHVPRGSPFLDLCNLREFPISNHHATSPEISSPTTRDIPIVKKRRLELSQEDGRAGNSAGDVCARNVEGSSITDIHTARSVHQANDNSSSLLKLRNAGRSPDKNTLRPTDQDLDEDERERRRKVKFESILVAEQFHRDRPDQAERYPEWVKRTRQKAWRVRRKMASSGDSAGHCTKRSPTRPLDSRLGAQQALIEDEEMEIDIERTEQLKASFLEGFAKGLRPGLVIPRLNIQPANAERT